MEQKQEQQDGNNFASLAIWILAVVLILWVLLGLVAFNIKWVVGWFSPALANSINPGTFGDMFGAANALFSALAIGGVVLTLWVQIKELKEARDDRKANLEHQEVIARSQERAAEMQLKVAQSGDVYKAFEAVAGTEFAVRLQRLHWFARAAVKASREGDPLTQADVFEWESLKDLVGRVQSMRPPNYYSTTFDNSQYEDAATGDAMTIALRIAEDMTHCASAVMNLRAGIALELLQPERIRTVLEPKDCWLLAAGSRSLHSFYKREPEFFELLAGMLQLEFDDD